MGEKQTIDLAPKFAANLPIFSKWARGKALGMRLNAAPSPSFSFDAEAIDAADPAAAAQALAQGLKEWKASPARRTLVQELSRIMAMPDASADGSPTLAMGSADDLQFIRLDPAAAKVWAKEASSKSRIDQHGEAIGEWNAVANRHWRPFAHLASSTPLNNSLADLTSNALAKHLGAVGDLSKRAEKIHLASAAGSGTYSIEATAQGLLSMHLMGSMDSWDYLRRFGTRAPGEPGFMDGLHGAQRDGFPGFMGRFESMMQAGQDDLDGLHRAQRHGGGAAEFMMELAAGNADPSLARAAEKQGLAAVSAEMIPRGGEDWLAVACLPWTCAEYGSLDPKLHSKRDKILAVTPMGRRWADSVLDLRPLVMKRLGFGSQTSPEDVAALAFLAKSIQEIQQERQSLQEEARLLAAERVAHWAGAHGVEDLSEPAVLARLEGGDSVDPNWILNALTEGKARMGAGRAEGLIAAHMAAAKGQAAGVPSAFAQWELHGERLDAFAASPQARALADALLGSAGLPHDAKQALGSIATLACLADFESGAAEPAPWASSGDALLDALRGLRPMESMPFLRAPMEWLPDSCQAASIAMGPAAAMEWLAARCEEQNRQRMELARGLLAGEFDRAGQRTPQGIASQAAEKFGLATLPRAWAREDEPFAALHPTQAAPSAAPKELDALGGTFADEMARLAWAAGMRPDLTAPAEGEHAVRNALLGQGKAAAKQWLGLTEAAWKGAREGSVHELEALLRAAKKISAAARRNVAALDAARERIATDVASMDSESAIPAEAFSKAFGSGRGSAEAEVASAGLISWARQCRMEALGHPQTQGPGGGYEELRSSQFLQSALSPVNHGSSVAQGLRALAQEAQAKEDRRAAFALAAVERSEALLAEEMAKKPARARAGAAPAEPRSEKAKAIKRAGARLASELSDMADWANDQAGNFWGQLPKKFGWAELRAASSRWHEESASRGAQAGVGWAPIGLEWSDAKSGLRAQELCSPKDLAEEGRAMRHCVGGYSDTCRAGARIVSIRQGDRRVATLQLNADASGSWNRAQLKAACNADPSKAASAAASAILVQANEIAAKARDEAKLMTDQGAKQAAQAPLELPGFDPDERLRSVQEKLRAKAAHATEPVSTGAAVRN